MVVRSMIACIKLFKYLLSMGNLNQDTSLRIKGQLRQKLFILDEMLTSAQTS